MKIDLSNLNIALEAMDDKPISKPRTPKFEGTEEKPAWGDVDKTFGSFLSAYYKRTNKALPKDLPGSFKECSEEIRIWMAEHSILGNPKSDSFDDGVVLPVVNPKTGKLNKGGVRSANTYAGRVKGVSDATIRRTKELLSELYDEHFKKEEPSNESLEVSEEGLKELQKYLESESRTIEQQVKKSAELLKTEIDENVWRN